MIYYKEFKILCNNFKIHKIKKDNNFKKDFKINYN